MLEFSERKRFVDDLVLVDGITRAGKFALAHVVSALDGVEFFQYPYLLETLLYLHRLGKLDFDTCRALAHLDLDSKMFEMMIGRSLNTRVHDLSCIYRAADPEEYVRRAATEDRTVLVQQFQDNHRLPVYINHEGLSNLQTLCRIFPGAKMINILREPTALVGSWYKRGWGHRIGTDPTAGWIAFKGVNGPRPWWTVDWLEDYGQLSEMDRCVKSIGTLMQLAREAFDAATPAVKARVLCVQFETLVTDPHRVITTISAFLDRRPGAALPGILTRERLPRPVAPDQRQTRLDEIRGLMSPGLEPLLSAMLTDYDTYWCGLCT